MLLLAPEPGENELSKLPSGLRRTILPVGNPFHNVNCPATKIFPSAWTARALTELLGPLPLKSNEGSG